MVKISRRAFVRLISYTAALVVALSAAAISGYTVANRNRTMIEYGLPAGAGRADRVSGQYGHRPGKGPIRHLSQSIGGARLQAAAEAGFAKNALSRLPLNGDELSGTYRFLSQVGNFCATLSKRVAEGGQITEEETASLQKLAAYASDLTDRLAAMESALGRRAASIGRGGPGGKPAGGGCGFP